MRKANTEAERLALWKARKGAFGTIGRLGYPSYCTQDGVVPRTKLPEIMRHIQPGRAEKYGIAIANVFHAGDGNIHPVLLFDERDPAQVQKVLDASHEILDECIRLGGSVTGRARHRRGEARLHAQAVRPGRPGVHGPAADGVQPGRPLQPRQDAADRRRLRRAGFRGADQAGPAGGVIIGFEGNSRGPTMGRIILDDELRSRLNGLTEPVELCDAGGRVLALVTPCDEFVRETYEWARTEVTDEELDRVSREPGESTLGEFKKRMGWA